MREQTDLSICIHIKGYICERQSIASCIKSMNSFIVEYLYLIIFDYFSDGGTIHGHRRDDVKNLVKDGGSLDH